jgi:hypothetical protein
MKRFRSIGPPSCWWASAHGKGAEGPIWGDRGRDDDFSPPPARTRTRPIKAYGSYLECLTANRICPLISGCMQLPSSRGPDRYRLSGGGRRGACPRLLTPSDTSVLYPER